MDRYLRNAWYMAGYGARARRLLEKLIGEEIGSRG